MTDRLAKVERFLARHHATDRGPLLLPNPWDAGIARLLTALEFEALATTSSGHAGTLGRLDYGVARDEALDHAAGIVAATDLPVSADLENGFGDTPDDAAETIRRACEAGLAGGSIEDFTGDRGAPIYERNHAIARVAAAAEVARRAETRFVLTARAENALHGQNDFEDTLARLVGFAEAGADVVYAPGLVDLDEVRRVVSEVPVPVNVLLRPKGPQIAELAAAGVARISLGGSLHLLTLAAVADAAAQLHEGRSDFLEAAAGAVPLRNRAFRAERP